MVERKTRSEEHTSELQSHRDLHSFPTRRSSDLCSMRFAAVGCSIRQGPASSLHFASYTSDVRFAFANRQASFDRSFLASGDFSNCRMSAAKSLAEWLSGKPDRKSTRLNSSHTEIYTLSLHDALPISAQ